MKKSKTAKEYASKLFPSPAQGGFGTAEQCRLLNVEIINQIQDGARHDALTEAADAASQFSITQQPIHPDIPAGKMGEDAKTVYHMTCQTVAIAIVDLRDNPQPPAER